MRKFILGFILGSLIGIFTYKKGFQDGREKQAKFYRKD
jgi:hypothetical protein